MRKHRIIIGVERVPGVDDGTRALLRRVVRTALETEGVAAPCEVNVLVTNDAGIRELNLAQRGVDAATDVLSFPMFTLSPGEQPMDADPETGLVPLGDIALSYERALAQAKEYGHSNRRELAYLTVHSVLHLLGYDHMDEGPEKQLLRAHEEAVMDKLSLKS